MKVSINGKLFFDGTTEQFFKTIDSNSYNSIGEAISDKIHQALDKTEWYHVEPKNFDLINNFQDVQLICKDNFDCYLDSFNWSIMNKTELTKDIYKFIIDREYVFREGFKNNFLPKHVDFQALMELIDWHFILDCISWFF